MQDNQGVSDISSAADWGPREAKWGKYSGLYTNTGIGQRYRRKVLYKSHYLWVASLNVYFHCSCRQQDETGVSSVSRVGLCCAFPAGC